MTNFASGRIPAADGVLPSHGYREPDRRRGESELRTAQGELTHTIVAVWDGTDWWLDVVSVREGGRMIRVVRPEDVPVAGSGLGVLSIDGPGAADLTTLLAEVANCYRGEVVGAGLRSPLSQCSAMAAYRTASTPSS